MTDIPASGAEGACIMENRTHHTPVADKSVDNNQGANKQVIEFNGEAVGVVVPDAGMLKFVAVKYQVWDLDARSFASAEAARHAVIAHLAGSGGRRSAVAGLAA
jgi:hypothetical protein